MSEMAMSSPVAANAAAEGSEKVGIGAYIALLFAIILFSGVFYKMPAEWKWLGAFDFTTLIGKFGSVAGTVAGKTAQFRGSGGISARDGFLFSLTLFPGVMLAMGLVEVLAHYGALRAAQALMTPILKPLLGIPGNTALPLITDLQSTDGGAAITRGMYDQGLIDKKQLITICAWQYAGAGGVANYTSTVQALFLYFTCAIGWPLLLIIIFKFVGAALVRLVLNTVYRKDFE